MPIDDTQLLDAAVAPPPPPPPAPPLEAACGASASVGTSTY